MEKKKRNSKRRSTTAYALIKFKNLSLLVESGCIEWQGAIDNRGYGRIYVEGKYCLAHKWGWESLHGKVQTGLELDHLCRNRKCVNPNHLEAVTHEVNMQRGNGFAGINARKTHCLRGHPFNEENTVILRLSSRECLLCRRIRQERANKRAIENRRLKRERNMVSKMFCDSV